MRGTSGFLDFSVAACDHSAADMPAGGCSRAATECVIPLHPRATLLTDLRDQARPADEAARATLPGRRLRTAKATAESGPGRGIVVLPRSVAPATPISITIIGPAVAIAVMGVGSHSYTHGRNSHGDRNGERIGGGVGRQPFRPPCPLQRNDPTRAWAWRRGLGRPQVIRRSVVDRPNHGEVTHSHLLV